MRVFHEVVWHTDPDNRAPNRTSSMGTIRVVFKTHRGAIWFDITPHEDEDVDGIDIECNVPIKVFQRDHKHMHLTEEKSHE